VVEHFVSKWGGKTFAEFAKSSNTVARIIVSQTLNKKVLSQEGNSPDRYLRSLKITKLEVSKSII